MRSLKALAETSTLINSSQGVDQVLNQVIDTVIQLTGAERGYIVLRSEITGELVLNVARGLDQSDLYTDASGLVISRSIVNRVADTAQPVLTSNASEDARFEANQSVAGFALRSILAVPLIVRQQVIGMVYCDNRMLSGVFQPSELALLTAFANQAAVAIDNARLFESARERLRQVTQMRDLIDNVFTSLASGVITLDEDGAIMLSNAAAVRMTGHETLNGRHLSDVLPDMGPDFAEHLRTVARTGQTHTIAAQPVFPEHGQRQWNLVISPLRDQASGVSYGVAIVMDDLTEQKRREAQVQEVRRYLPGALIETVRQIDDIDVAGQERMITALAADVRGFTTFSEHLEPELLMATINQHLSLASDAINLYEGVVDKYMGDAVTGLFNTQLNPQQDHALRAVQAAWQMMLDLRALHEVLPASSRLWYGLGIHTGPVVLGTVGGKDRREFAALGEAVNISRYLEANAEPGWVLISSATYEQVQYAFTCEPVTSPRRPQSAYSAVSMFRVTGRRDAERPEGQST